MANKKPVTTSKSKKSDKLSKSQQIKSPVETVSKTTTEKNQKATITNTQQNKKLKNNISSHYIMWAIFIISFIAAVGLYYYQLEKTKINDSDKFSELEQKLETFQINLTNTLLTDQTNKIEKINNNLNQVLKANSYLSEQNQNLLKKIDAISLSDKLAPMEQNTENKPKSKIDKQSKENIEIEKNKLILAIQKAQTTVKSLEKKLKENELKKNILIDLNSVNSAFLEGRPFGKALLKIGKQLGLSFPEEIQENASKGIKSLEQLRSAFPKEARAALKALNNTEIKQTGSEKILTLIKTHITTRSLKPVSGDSVDAILSRAEKNLTLNSLENALAELQNLPKNAKRSMNNWILEAQINYKTMKELEKLFIKIQELRDGDD